MPLPPINTGALRASSVDLQTLNLLCSRLLVLMHHDGMGWGKGVSDDRMNHASMHNTHPPTESGNAGTIKDARRLGDAAKWGKRTVAADVNEVGADESVEHRAACICGLESQVVAAPPQRAQARLECPTACLNQLFVQWHGRVSGGDEHRGHQSRQGVKVEARGEASNGPDEEQLVRGLPNRLAAGIARDGVEPRHAALGRSLLKQGPTILRHCVPFSPST